MCAITTVSYHPLTPRSCSSLGAGRVVQAVHVLESDPSQALCFQLDASASLKIAMANPRKEADAFLNHEPISPLSPLSSRAISTFGRFHAPSEKYSPVDEPSPQSLYTKPWPSRPQKLFREIGSYRWWESTVDIIMVLIPMPFFILGAAVLAVNGKEVEAEELGILQQTIKAVSQFHKTTQEWQRLIVYRRPHSSRYPLLQLLEEQP